MPLHLDDDLESLDPWIVADARELSTNAERDVRKSSQWEFQ